MHHCNVCISVRSLRIAHVACKSLSYLRNDGAKGRSSLLLLLCQIEKKDSTSSRERRITKKYPSLSEEKKMVIDMYLCVEVVVCTACSNHN